MAADTKRTVLFEKSRTVGASSQKENTLQCELVDKYQNPKLQRLGWKDEHTMRVQFSSAVSTLILQSMARPKQTSRSLCTRYPRTSACLCESLVKQKFSANYAVLLH
jgi:hypothetical protein